MTVDVVTFGCRLNAYESEALKNRAGEAQLRDTLVINTCAVTAEAVRQSRQAIRRAKRENPARRIIVTGCAAQIEPQRYAAMPEVDAEFGNREKLSPAAYAEVARADFRTATETRGHGMPLSSFNAYKAYRVLMRAIEEQERWMLHFHLSAQSGDDLILKRMKRRHSRADVVRFCDDVRRLRPDAAFGADLIAGFPTE